MPPGFLHVPFNDQKALRKAVSDKTCAVMLELIQGESGVHPADLEYIQLARILCDQTGARLIIDEIQTGMGRTGHFLASQLYQVKPDIVTLAKGLGGGVPIGAVLANETTSSGFVPGDHGSTFGGNPLACAAAMAVLDVYEKEGLVAAAAQRGQQLKRALHDLHEQYPHIIKDVRGVGLMLACELCEPQAAAVKAAMMTRGYLIGSVGTSVLRLLPPLVLPEESIAPLIVDLEAVLKEVVS